VRRRTRGAPRLARAVLRVFIRDPDAREGILGDLEEEAEEFFGVSASPWRMWLWYWGAVLGLAVRSAMPRQVKASRWERGARSLTHSREGGGMDGLTRDLVFALRRLRGRPVFSVATAVILALGLGGTAAIFAVVDGLLLKPLPYKDPGRLVGVWYTAPGWQIDRFPGLNMSPAGYFTYRAESRTLEDIAVWDNTFVTVTSGSGPERVPAMAVTDGIFGVLGVKPILGRAFSREDDTPGSELTVMLGYGYWQRRFGGSADVLGRAITVDGRPHEVIGVLPRGWTILSKPADIYVPARFDRAQATVGDFSYQAIGRMRPDVTLEDVRADVNRMIPLSIRLYPGGTTLAQAESAKLGAEVHPLREELVADLETALWLLFGAMATVLAIAWANVANLVLVRNDGRLREVAVRTAIGASRARVVTGLFLEGLVLSLVGAAGGLLLAGVGLDAFRSWGPQEIPRLQELSLNPTVVSLTLLLALGGSVAFALIPALRITRASVTTMLGGAGRTMSKGRSSVRMRNALVVSQVALALLLMVTSGLMARSFGSLRKLDPGFTDPDHVLTFRVNLPDAQVPAAEDVARFHETVVQELLRLPDVVSATGTNSVPMDGWTSNQTLFIEDSPTPDGERPPEARVKWVGGAYFSTLGISIRVGRGLTWADTRERSPVVVVNAAYARIHWGDPTKALGRRIAYRPDRWYEIVGVSANTYDDGLDRPAVPVVYWPVAVPAFWGHRLWVPRWFAYVVRTRTTDPADLLPRIRKIVHDANPDIPVFGVQSLAAIRDRSLLRTSVTAGLLAIATLMAVLLAVVGVYGVVSYSVVQRTREIGIRLALGATQANVHTLVLRDGLVLVGVGVALGLLSATGLTRFMSALLYGVRPGDIATYGLAALAVAGVAVAATWLPARAATRVDPVKVISSE
jgi:putative ABC transport system permease protein